MSFRIALQSKPSPNFYERHKRCQVLLNGEPWGEPFHDNMRGFRGALPTSDGRGFDPGEVTLTRCRREVPRLRPLLAAEYIALEEEIGHTLSPARMPLRDIIA